MRTARGIICRCNWIADYTIIKLVKISRELLAMSTCTKYNKNCNWQFNGDAYSSPFCFILGIELCLPDKQLFDLTIIGTKLENDEADLIHLPRP